MDTIKRNDTGAAVEDVQQRLVTAGFLAEDAVTGVFDDATVAAVRAFRKQEGLPDSDEVDGKTWAALVDASYHLGDRTLYLRMPYFHGNDVAELQNALGALGFACGGADGIFGAYTEDALRTFGSRLGFRFIQRLWLRIPSGGLLRRFRLRRRNQAIRRDEKTRSDLVPTRSDFVPTRSDLVFPPCGLRRPRGDHPDAAYVFLCGRRQAHIRKICVSLQGSNARSPRSRATPHYIIISPKYTIWFMKKIRAAVVGYGNIGHFAVQALEAADDFEVAGIVRRQGADNCPDEIRHYPVVKNIRELEAVDVAILATPHPQR